ncbi:MAG: aldo/keto reductase [Geminicoccales bacterium]
MSSLRMNRREFIAAIGTAAFAAIANTRAAQSPSVASAGIQKRAIPSSGEQLPVIGMGTSGTFDVGATEAERAPLIEVLRVLFDGGGTLIDTAPSYGRAETVTGDLLEQGDWRQRAFLATKISARAGGAQAQWNGSLADLRSDKVDLLQVHNLVDWRENLAFLRELKQAGQIRYLGVTHYQDHAHDELARIVQAERIDFVQVNYSAATRSAEKRLLPLCKERGVAVLVNRAFEDGRLFDRVQGQEVPAWAAEIDCRSWGQLFLKFVLANPAVTAVIPATSKARHMLDNLGAGVGAVADAKYQDRIAALVS